MTDQPLIEPKLHFYEEDAVLTPEQAERYLKQINNELARAQIALKRHRYQELKLKKSYTEVKTALMFSDDCPKVGRSDGQVTVDERDAWINSRIPDYWPYESAQVQRDNAEDYLRTVGKQVSIAQSLNNSAKEVYKSYGGGRP